MNISEVSQDIVVPTLTKTKKQICSAAYQRKHRQLHLERDRQYRYDYHIANNEYRNAYSRDYYVENKDVINEKQAEKFKCLQCGGKYTRSNKLQHERQGIHIKSLEINEIIK